MLVFDPFYRQHQTKLYIRMLASLEDLLSFRQPPGDLTIIFRHILWHELTQLIIRHPFIGYKRLHFIMTDLVQKMESDLDSEWLYSDYPVQRHVAYTFHRNIHVGVVLHTLQYYCRLFFDESPNERFHRIHQIIDQEALQCPLSEKEHNQVKLYLNDLIDRYYFLSNDDVKCIHRQLVNAFMQKTQMFSPDPLERSSTFSLYTPTRPLFLSPLTINSTL